MAEPSSAGAATGGSSVSPRPGQSSHKEHHTAAMCLALGPFLLLLFSQALPLSTAPCPSGPQGCGVETVSHSLSLPSPRHPALSQSILTSRLKQEVS